MITDVILDNASLRPNKIAISYGDYALTFGELATKVSEFGTSLIANEKYLIDSVSPIEAIAKVLACQLKGSIGLVIHSDITNCDRAHLIEVEGFRNFSTSEININNSGATYSEKYFLGVLTSGSTSVPKVIFKNNDCWEKAFAHQGELFGISEGDNILVLDAVAYSANLNAILHGLWVGATVTLCSLNKSRSWLELVSDRRITSIFMVPSHLNLLKGINAPTTVCSIVTAGEKLCTKLASYFLETIPSLLLTEYYGTAELGHITYQQNYDILSNPLSVGSTFPEVQLTVEKNQLYVDSPFVSPEFKNIGTVGDLGTWENGRLILLGRSGKMFNRRGLNIFAREIEQKALLFPEVEESFLLEVTRNKRKKLILLFTSNQQVLADQNTADALSKYLKALLPLAKRPNQIIEVERFPRMSNGKVDEKGLKLQLDYADEDSLI